MAEENSQIVSTPPEGVKTSMPQEQWQGNWYQGVGGYYYPTGREATGGNGGSEQGMPDGQKAESEIPSAQPTKPTEPSLTPSISESEIPTTPDSPGGQVATVNGQEVYIKGSTMREVYGFETPEQYQYAQRHSLGRVGNAWFGALVGGEAAVKNIAQWYGIPEAEAKRLITLAWANPKDPELATLTNEQLDALVKAGTKGATPWDYVPEMVAEGTSVYIQRPLEQKFGEGKDGYDWVHGELQQRVLAPTREQEITKQADIEEASQILQSKGVNLSDISTIDLKDPQVRQALYDVKPEIPKDVFNEQRQKLEAQKSEIPQDLYYKQLANINAQEEAYGKGGFVAYVREAQQQAETEFQANLAQQPQSLQDAYNTGGIPAYEAKFNELYQPLSDKNYMLKSDLEELKTKSPDLYNIAINQGYDAYKAEVQKIQDNFDRLNGIFTDYRSGKLPDIQTENSHWITENGRTVQYVRSSDGTWEKADVSEPLPPSGYKYNAISIAKDIENNKLDRADAEVYFGKDFVNQALITQSALNILDTGGYRSTRAEYPQGGAPFESYTTEGAYGYDVQQFVKDNPTYASVQVLKDAQFKPEIVDTAQKYVDSIQDFIKKADSMTPGQFQGINMLALERAELATGAKADKSQGDIIAWNSMSDVDKQNVALYYINDPFKANPYADVVASLEVVKASLPTPVQYGILGGEIALLFYPPTAGIIMPIIAAEAVVPTIAKATVGEKIGGWEIATDAAMTALAILTHTSPAIVRAIPGVMGKVTVGTLQGAAIGTFAGNLGFNWGKMSPIDRAINVGMLVAIPVAKGVKWAGETLKAQARTLTTEGGILPSGLKTGGQDLAFVEVPDIFKGIEGKVADIIRTKPPEQQAPAIRELLNPENQKIFDAYMDLANRIPDMQMPDSMIKPTVDFTDVQVLKNNQAVADGIKAWLQANVNDVYVGGSTARAQQLAGVSEVSAPHDLDFNIRQGSKLTPESAISELANTVRRYAPDARVEVDGTKLKINGVDTSDIHVEGYAGKSQFGWVTTSKPVVIDGVAFADIKQLLYDLLKAPTTPTVGETAGMLFPVGEPFPRGKIGETVFGTIEPRVKDIMAGNIAFKGIADAMAKTNPELAGAIRSDLYTTQTTPLGKPIAGAVTDAEGKARFLDMVAKAQQYVLDTGMDAAVVDSATGGRLIRIASPASKVMSDVLYTAVRDITPYVEGAKQGYFEVGKILGVKGGELTIPSEIKNLASGKIRLDANGIPIDSGSGIVDVKMPDGKTVQISKNQADVITRSVSNGIDAGRYITFEMQTTDAPRNELFTSPDAAFDFLLEREAGVLPDKAGIIALRTTSADTSNLNMIGTPFRYEMDAKGKPIVYDERIVASGTKAYSTRPTALSLSGKGITDGATGETMTYYPRTKTPVPMLWFVTDSAKAVDLGAPTLTQFRAINWLAFKAMVSNILRPHINTDIEFKWSDTKRVSGSLFDFYKKTYEWKGKSESEIRDAVNKETDALAKEAVDNLKSRGELENRTPEEAQRLIDNEVERIIDDRVKTVMQNDKVMAELARRSGDDIVKPYVVNVSELLGGLSKVAMGTTLPAARGIAGEFVLGETVPLGETAKFGETELPKTVAPSTEGKIGETMVEVYPEQAVSLGETLPTGVTALSETAIPSEGIPTTTKPVIPTEPTEATIPTEPTIPTIPTEPVTPTEPTEPTIPTTPTEPTIPTTPTESTIPTTPTETTTITTTTTPELTKKPEKIIPLIWQSEIPDAWGNKVPPGTITWRQGMKWGVLPPPWRDEDKIWLDHPLPGTKKFAVGKGSAYKTLQVLGGRPAQDADIDMGWAQIHISSKNGQMQMTFGGGQEAANDRWAMEQQYMDELAKESYQGIPQGLVEVSRIPRKRVALPLENVGEIYPPEVSSQPLNEIDLLLQAMERGRETSKVNASRLGNRYYNEEDMIYVPSYYRKKIGTSPIVEDSGIKLQTRTYLGRRLRPTSVGTGV